MGPVTQTGCGALCPQMGRACYACYGPSENPNTQSLSARFKKNGLPEQADRKSTRLNSSHTDSSRMPSSA